MHAVFVQTPYSNTTLKPCISEGKAFQIKIRKRFQSRFVLYIILVFSAFASITIGTAILTRKRKDRHLETHFTRPDPTAESLGTRLISKYSAHKEKKLHTSGCKMCTVHECELGEIVGDLLLGCTLSDMRTSFHFEDIKYMWTTRRVAC